MALKNVLNCKILEQLQRSSERRSVFVRFLNDEQHSNYMDDAISHLPTLQRPRVRLFGLAQ